MTTTRKLALLALPFAIGLAACGSTTPTTTAAPTPVQRLVLDPVPATAPATTVTTAPVVQPPVTVDAFAAKAQAAAAAASQAAAAKARADAQAAADAQARADAQAAAAAARALAAQPAPMLLCQAGSCNYFPAEPLSLFAAHWVTYNQIFNAYLAKYVAQAASGFGTILNTQAWSTALASAWEQQDRYLLTGQWPQKVYGDIQQMGSVDIGVTNDLKNIVVGLQLRTDGLSALAGDLKTSHAAVNVVRADLGLAPLA